MKKNIAKAAVTAAAASVVAVAVPAGNAAATNNTECTSADLLQINSGRGAFCFANGGDALTDFQIDKVTNVSTGNNAVVLRDTNGQEYSLRKGTNVNLDNVTIDYIKIL